MSLWPCRYATIYCIAGFVLSVIGGIVSCTSLMSQRSLSCMSLLTQVALCLCKSLSQDVHVVIYVVIVTDDFVMSSVTSYHACHCHGALSCMTLLSQDATCMSLLSQEALSHVGHSYKGPNVIYVTIVTKEPNFMCVINPTTRCHVHYKCQM